MTTISRVLCITAVLWAAGGLVVAQEAARAEFTPPGENIALGKPYTLSPRPNYALSADPGDVTHLTDGVYSEGYFWVQKTTVGWRGAAPVIITVDLGEVEPIAGASYNTAAGVANVSWPLAIDILVSDDGERWVHIGELVGLSAEFGLPPTDRYAVHRFVTDDLRTRARYVQFVVDGAPYIFVDEVEVYRGPDEFLALEPEGRVVTDPRQFFMETRIFSGIKWRLQFDLDAARDAIAEADLPADRREALSAAAAEMRAEIADMPSDIPEDFTTVLPFSDLHARIYALNAPLLRARGLTRPLYVWEANPWDPLQPTDAPTLEQVGAPPRLDVRMMRNEWRGAAFNLTNTTDEEMQVTVNVNGLWWGANPEQVSVREVLFTDTRERAPISAALPVARRDDDGHHVTIPAGCSRQVWLNIRSVDTPADERRSSGTVLIEGGGETLEVPLELTVYPFDFPDEVSIAVGGWDYTMGRGAYDATPENIPLLIQTMREHYVNTPWAQSSVRPRGAQFDQEGNLTGELDFAVWDEWVERWPDTLWYCVFMSVGRSFEGEEMGTPRFNRMVGDYFVAWTEHMREQGIPPEKLAVLLVDEPHNEEMAERIIVWAEAIKAAAPEVVIWNDPTYRDPREMNPELVAVSDVLCPNLPMWMGFNEEMRSIYLDAQAEGTQLWFYSCSGPAKLLDPYDYWRGQFWWALRHNAEGSHYWAFADEAGSVTSWNAYRQVRNQYSPLFIDPTSVTEGKQMAAIREGAQDHEYFVMLRGRIAELERAGVTDPLLEQARRLVAHGPLRVTDDIAPGTLSWRGEKDRGVMDAVRVEVLEMLLRLSELG